ncbi:Rid family hydrolase [Desulfospira joergensenii]
MIGEHLEDFKRIKDEFINEIYPAWTAIGVSELAVEGALIEIRVIAKLRA